MSDMNTPGEPQLPPAAPEEALPPASTSVSSGYTPTSTPPTPTPDKIQSESRLWAMLSHLTALCGFIGIPFGHILGPLIVWLIKKDQFPLVDDQGKESLNFQITMTIYGIVAGLLTLVFIGFVLLAVLVIADIVLVIMASIEANKGTAYRYPFTIRLIK
jgi:uncharacterized Tic20 family protein